MTKITLNEKKIIFDFSTTVETYSINQFFVRKKVVIQTASEFAVKNKKYCILMMTATYISLLIDKKRLMFSERRKKALINVEITLLSPPTKKQNKPTHVLLEKK